MGPIGAQEMIAIFVIALLLFGPKKLPELGRLVGKALTEFRRAKNELKTTFETHLHELDKEVQLQQPVSSRPTYSSDYSYTHPEYGSYDADYHSSSGSYEAPKSLEATASQPITASETATQDAPAHQDHPPLQEPVIPGTVARSTGAHSTESNYVHAEENHPA